MATKDEAIQINLRLPQALLDRVDKHRGLIPREAWIRSLIIEALPKEKP